LEPGGWRVLLERGKVRFRLRRPYKRTTEKTPREEFAERLSERIFSRGSCVFAGFFAACFFDFEFVTAFADLVFEFFASFAEFADALTNAASELRELFGSEKEEEDEENEDHFLSSEGAEKGERVIHGLKVGCFSSVGKV